MSYVAPGAIEARVRYHPKRVWRQYEALVAVVLPALPHDDGEPPSASSSVGFYRKWATAEAAARDEAERRTSSVVAPSSTLVGRWIYSDHTTAEDIALQLKATKSMGEYVKLSTLLIDALTAQPREEWVERP